MSDRHRIAFRGTWLNGIVAVLLAGVVGPARAQDDQSPAVEFTPPGVSLVGDALAVRATGLPADTEVVLFCEMVDRYGRLWLGEAAFRSDADGVVDPAAQAPTDGAWDDADALGPLWSLTRRTMSDAHPRPEGGAAERVSITVAIDGRPRATASVLRRYRLPNVVTLEVPDDTLAAALFAPAGTDRRPAVLLLPGSGGGVPRPELFASHGYVAMGLGYFGEPSTPPDLELVPLEYVDRAIDALRMHPRVDPARIAIMGGSKGGELALLVASRRPDLAATIAAVPSSVVFQSINPEWRRTSSWSIGGEPLPFVPYARSARFRETGRLSFLYEDSLADTAAVAAAAISVERAGGPILLISGADDRTWPSSSMCRDLINRLEAADFPHRVVHLDYENVGHEVWTAGFRPVSWSPRVGGTPQGHAAGQADAWNRTLVFLAETIGASR